MDAEKPERRQPGSTRDRIMEAAAAVAHAVGPAHLSLDAVAEQAGVSKGGLLYHFPTKVSLLKAIVERHLETIEHSVGIDASDGAAEGDAVAIALMRGFCDTPSSKPGGARGFLAAMAETPELMEPIRAHNERVANCLRRAREPEVALMAFLVVEGMRCLQIFDTNPITDAEREQIMASLARILSAPEHA